MIHGSVGFQMDPFVEHGLPSYLADTPDNDLAAFTFGMTIHYRQYLLETHGFAPLGHQEAVPKIRGHG
ncbi:hypothetical protein TZ03_11280 [Pseudomonas sp. 10-1B]|nr:hypothetical protein TZ03_11280 [Pseudomonas sp. 10-1B]